MLNCRIFPNGEFSVWDEKRDLAVEGPPAQPDYLGLTLLPNSHRVSLGMAEPPGERAKRGSKGITRHGARMVRNAAFLLQEKYGKDVLGFYTFTLPPTTATTEYALALQWSEVVRVFLQSVKRLLTAAGLPGSYVGCTEIQTKRYNQCGGMPLHLHLVCVGRVRGGAWAIHSDQWRALWRRALVTRCPEYAAASFKASVDTQRVKESIEGYLGKYMSKGVAALGPILVEDPGIVEFLPSSWWFCAVKLRRAIGARLTGGSDSARRLARDIRTGDTRVGYARQVTVALAGGELLPVALVGRLTAEGRRLYCARVHGLVSAPRARVKPVIP